MDFILALHGWLLTHVYAPNTPRDIYVIIASVLLLLSVPVGGFMWRVRGGWSGDMIRQFIPFWGLTTQRITAAFWYALPLVIYTANPVYFLMIFTLWVGMMQGWFDGLDMGRHAGTWIRDACAMACRGFIITTPTAILFFFLGMSIPTVVVFSLSSILWFPLSYELGYRITESSFGKKYLPSQFNYEHEFSEFCGGATLAIALALAVYIH